MLALRPHQSDGCLAHLAPCRGDFWVLHGTCAALTIQIRDGCGTHSSHSLTQGAHTGKDCLDWVSRAHHHSREVRSRTNLTIAQV